MKIPFVDLTTNYKSIRKDIGKSIQEVLHTSQFIKGPHVKKFEEQFAEFVGAKYAIGVASGTDALHISLVALGITKGDEVIMPANTFAATAYAVLYTGATPILVDIEEESFNIDINLLEKAITPKTKVIIPVHLYGNPAKMRAIKKIAKKHNLYILEDACQAHGAWYENKRTGCLGDIAAFSFYPGKNLGAYGDGGAITTNSPELATKVMKLREYGSLTKYEYDILGFNSRLDAIQAAVLNVKLKSIEKWNRKRIKAASYYTRRLLKEVPQVIPPSEKAFSNSVFHLYVIRTAKRDKLMEFLDKADVQTGIHYPVPLHLQKSLETLNYKKGDFLTTEVVSGEILSLPLYPEITKQQQDYVLKQIKKFFNK